MKSFLLRSFWPLPLLLLAFAFHDTLILEAFGEAIGTEFYMPWNRFVDVYMVRFAATGLLESPL